MCSLQSCPNLRRQPGCQALTTAAFSGKERSGCTGWPRKTHTRAACCRPYSKAPVLPLNCHAQRMSFQRTGSLACLLHLWMPIPIPSLTLSVRSEERRARAAPSWSPVWLTVQMSGWRAASLRWWTVWSQPLKPYGSFQNLWEQHTHTHTQLLLFLDTMLLYYFSLAHCSQQR